MNRDRNTETNKRHVERNRERGREIRRRQRRDRNKEGGEPAGKGDVETKTQRDGQQQEMRKAKSWTRRGRQRDVRRGQGHGRAVGAAPVQVTEL